MDIFAHGLWAGVLTRAANFECANKKPLRVRWAVFWGVFPDLFTFIIPVGILFYGLILGESELPAWPRTHGRTVASPDEGILLFQYTHTLYSISHSAVIFLLTFFIVWFFAKRPVWEMGGWFLHVLIDIPTHSNQFYPTPFLWPVSSFGVNGFPWANPVFLTVNYLLIATAYSALYFVRKKTKMNHDRKEKNLV